MYDANGKVLYDNTWRSSYVGEPSLVRVGTKKPAKKPGAKAKQPVPGKTPATATPAAGALATVGPGVTTPVQP